MCLLLINFIDFNHLIKVVPRLIEVFSYKRLCAKASEGS
jgi:hypothetical protein